MNGLAIQFERLWQETKNKSDLERAITFRDKLLEAIPNYHPSRALHAHELSVSLRHRLEDNPEAYSVDIDRIIQLGKEAVAGTPLDHPNRITFSNSLFYVLEARRHQHPEAGFEESLAEIEGTFPAGQVSLNHIRAAQDAAHLLIQRGNFSEACLFLRKGITILLD
jgi:hypothetical protein